MSKFEDYFTHMDDIRRAEPEYGKASTPTLIEPKARGDLESFLKKTPLQILEEGCTAANPGDKVDWTMQQYGSEFEMTCQLLAVKGVGRNVNKKIAKQKAAVDYLRKIVKKGTYKDYYIPGNSEKEANDAMDQLEKAHEARKNGGESLPAAPEKHVETENEIPTSEKSSDNVDWIGKLQEILHKMRIQSACYDFQEEGDPTNKKFIFTCSVGAQKTRGISTTKKTAKKIAARLMYDILEHGGDMFEAVFPAGEYPEDQDQEWQDARRLQKIEEDCLKEKDPEDALEQILSDKGKFSRYEKKYRFRSESTKGFDQVMLEIDVSPVDRSDVDDLEVGAEHTQTEEIAKATAQKEKEWRRVMEGGPFVFCGYGSTKSDADRNACQSALIHFKTYAFP